MVAVLCYAFLFQGIHENHWRKLAKENTETMKNYSNHSSESNTQDYELDGVPLAEISEFVIYEVLLALISLVIVSTSSLVIYRIKKAQTKNVRSDFAFICLSVSDIGVGFFSGPTQGFMHYYIRSPQETPFFLLIISNFFYFFPCTYFLAYSQQLLH